MPTDPLLIQAVHALASVDDGAKTQDGVGFNGTDTKFGNALATTPPEAWSVENQREAWEMLAKYKGQLARVNIDYDAIPEPSARQGSRGIRVVDVRKGKVLVFLPYEDTAYPKTALNAVWNRTERGWQVAVSKYGSVISWAERNDIAVTSRARAILDTAPSDTKDDWAGTASLEGGEIVLKFDYNPKIVDAVRTVQGRRWNADDKTWRVPKQSVAQILSIANEHHLFVTLDVKRLPVVPVDSNPKILVHNRNFAISFNYDAEMVTQVRQMPASVWSAELRMWLVPIESSDEVLKFKNQHDARVSKEAEELLTEAEGVQDIIEASQAKDANITVKGLGNETFQPFPFQRAGIAYAMKAMGYEYDNGDWKRGTITNGGVLIGDEMGLGKTVQGIGVLVAANAFPAVIVCPASLKLNWKREIERWTNNTKTVAVISGTSGDLPEADVIVCNYDILSYHVEKFSNIKGIVLDESHYIKNGSAQRSKASIALSGKVVDGGVRVCLSGTAIVNQPLEIMTQLRVINRLADFGGATPFRNTYGRASSRSLAALNRKLRSTCYVRRRKAEVLTELPPKMWSRVIVEGDSKVMAEYRKAEADIVKYLTEIATKLALESGATDKEAQNEAWRKALKARAAEHLVSISTLKQLAAKAKMKVAEQWVNDFLENDKKLVVFGWHRAVVDAIADQFSNGVKIQGGISSEKRQEAVDKFQCSDEQKVIACNIKAAGVGLTLTAASDVLFLEQGWTPSDMEQAVDRCHRIGQTDSVTGWLMLTANTIDEDIAMLIDAKRAIVNRAIDGSDDDDQEANSIVGDLLVSLAERGMSQ